MESKEMDSKITYKTRKGGSVVVDETQPDTAKNKSKSKDKPDLKQTEKSKESSTCSE